MIRVRYRTVIQAMEAVALSELPGRERLQLRFCTGRGFVSGNLGETGKRGAP